MLADPEIDAVYNPLPNHLHVDLTLAAARAGKHVLCEKPIGLDAEDAERLRAVPEGILVAEAFMVRYHPQWLRAREIARSGELGEVRAVVSLFTYFNIDPANVRNQADIGGGGILDIGCYPDHRRALHLRGRAEAGGVADGSRSGFPHRPAGKRDRRFRQWAAPHLSGLHPAH